MKHTIHILFLLMLSQSLTLANFVVCGRTGFYTSTNHDANIPIGIQIPSTALQKNISSEANEDLYHLLQNNDQDTTKTKSNTVLFGRSFLKNHFELHGKKAVVDQEKRTQWIRKAVDSLMLKNESDFPQLAMSELIHEEFYQASYRLIEKGMIIFDDGSYVKLISTSAHAISEIGDITLAVNELGDVYINQGHICGRIIHFRVHQKKLTLTAGIFFDHFSSDTDDEPWQLYTEGHKNKTNKQKF